MPARCSPWGEERAGRAGCLFSQGRSFRPGLVHGQECCSAVTGCFCTLTVREGPLQVRVEGWESCEQAHVAHSARVGGRGEAPDPRFAGRAPRRVPTHHQKRPQHHQWPSRCPRRGPDCPGCRGSRACSRGLQAVLTPGNASGHRCLSPLEARAPGARCGTSRERRALNDAWRHCLCARGQPLHDRCRPRAGQGPRCRKRPAGGFPFGQRPVG